MMRRNPASAAIAASMVRERIAPVEKVSRPSSTPRDASSIVRMVPLAAISLITRRMALAPMSTTATSSGAAASFGCSIFCGSLMRADTHDNEKREDRELATGTLRHKGHEGHEGHEGHGTATPIVKCR